MASNKTKYLMRIAVLSAIAFVLMYIDFPIPMLFPAFLKFDVSDIPAILGAFSMGPAAGALIEVIKNVLHLIVKGSETGGVGQLANLLTGCAWVIPIGFIYKKNKTKKNAVIGLTVGAISMIIAAGFINYYITLPFYQSIMPMEAIIGMGSVVNPAIKDYFTLVLYGITPFNIVKTLLISLLTIAMYKKVSPILHK